MAPKRGGGVQYRRRRMTTADVGAVAEFCGRHMALPRELERELPGLLERLLAGQWVFGGVVERLRRPGGEWELAACGLGTFMSDALHDAYFERPFPFVGVHVLEQARLGREEDVMISRAEVSRRQKKAPPTLDLLLPFWLQDDFRGESLEAWNLIFEGFSLMDRFLIGVRLRSFVFEGLDWDRRFFNVAGYARLADFTVEDVPTPYDYLKDDPRYIPHVHGIYTVDDFSRQPSNAPVARLFMFREPILNFTDNQKMVLDLAVEGYSDKEIAEILGLAPNAVRMRWRAIYEKMQAVLPDIFSEVENCNAGRGQEKRRLAIHYVRDHPEEIRPQLIVPPR